jgi:Ca2+-binding RTX toxin-like protein
MPTRAFSLPQVINQIDGGDVMGLGDGNINYGFATSNAAYSRIGEGAGFSSFNAGQRATVRVAETLWDDLIARSIVETNVGSADIKFANTTTNISYAHAYDISGGPIGGTIFFNPNYNQGSGENDVYNSVDVGSIGFRTYVHEMGHTLGLDHPGNYDGGRPTYQANAAYIQDTQQYTIMSYFDAENTGAKWTNQNGTFTAQTPMLHDVATIQQKYGADLTTRTGDTTYGFGATKDAMAVIYDFNINKNPIICVYDAGGIDTLNVSGFKGAANISLAAGSFSSFNGMQKNFSIANGVTIENATTGAGNDVVVGNSAANRIITNAGNDRVSAGSGNDTVIAGTGNDTVSGNNGNDRLFGQGGNDTMSGGADNDLMYGGADNDRLSGDNGNDVLFGDSGNDLLFGGNGDDRLYGGAGTDVLNGGLGNDLFRSNGGKDTFIGGGGNDTFYVTAGDKIVEERGPAGGVDTVVTSTAKADLNAYKYVENLTGTTTQTAKLGFDLTGNSVSNVLTGSFGNDRLHGAAGNDKLIGNQGNDIYTGGLGSDTFVFTSAGGADRVMDFQNGFDKISLRDVGNLSKLDAADVFDGGFIEYSAAGKGVNVYFDADGDAGNGSRVLIGHLADLDFASVTHDDFVFA